jgi:hypothetical protein
MGARLDHLVFAAESLGEGAARLESLLGVPFSPGGQHVTMGTYNRLLRIGETAYLEVIAIDPALPAPPHPRWFALDEPWMRDRLSRGPQLVTWIARSPDIEAAVAAYPGFGAPVRLSRGDLSWTITLTPQGRLIEGGVLPQLISWGEASPPARLPDQGVRLGALRLRHPQPGRIADALAAAGFDPAAIAQMLEKGEEPEVAAELETPAGRRSFTSLDGGREHGFAVHQPGGGEVREA